MNSFTRFSTINTTEWTSNKYELIQFNSSLVWLIINTTGHVHILLSCFVSFVKWNSDITNTTETFYRGEEGLCNAPRPLMGFKTQSNSVRKYFLYLPRVNIGYQTICIIQSILLSIVLGWNVIIVIKFSHAKQQIQA